MNIINRVELLEELKSTNPPISRLLSLVAALFPLISTDQDNELHRVMQLHLHSLVSPQFNIEQCFQMMHAFVSFKDRIACMVVNKEWRKAIRKPNIWKSWFGPSTVFICNRQIWFPNSIPFVKSMLPCWSELKGDLCVERSHALDHSDALQYWLQHSPGSYIHKLRSSIVSYGYLRALIDCFLYRFLPIIASRLVELHLVGFDAECFLNVRISHLCFPALQAMTVYFPFTQNFINAPHLKRLTLQAFSEMFSSTPVIIPYGELESVTLDTSLCVTDCTHVIWPRTLQQIVLNGGDIIKLIIAFCRSGVVNTHWFPSLQLRLQHTGGPDHSHSEIRNTPLFHGLHFIV